MKTISIFNNKGGVGKTTLTFHLAHALSELKIKTLLIDLDPQCNLTILSMDAEVLHDIWEKEDLFINDFKSAQENITKIELRELTSSPRSIHFLLKPTEDGVNDIEDIPPPVKLNTTLDLIPGRLTLHTYEDKISTRFPQAYQNDALAIRTLTKIRDISKIYAAKYGYEIVILDTSPSLGALNKVIISTADGIIIPCMPDMFSLYGIKNIGKSLDLWNSHFNSLYTLLSKDKRNKFPENFVKLFGYTIYNSRKYKGINKWDLATAQYNYATQIYPTICANFGENMLNNGTKEAISEPIGGLAVMHSHNTLINMAQKYHLPTWSVPGYSELETDDISTISGNKATYLATKSNYISFAKDLLGRIK